MNYIRKINLAISEPKMYAFKQRLKREKFDGIRREKRFDIVYAWETALYQKYGFKMGNTINLKR